MYKQLQPLRATAAQAVFAAFRTIFPKAHLIEARVTDFGFEIDLLSKDSITRETLSLIEERIQQEEIEEMEMVPISAAALLRHHRMPYRAEAVEASGHHLVTMCKMGDHVDWVESPFSKELGAITLLSVKKEHDIWRIEGTAHVSKEELKRAQKERKRLTPLAWETLITPYFFEEGGNTWWHPKGEQLRAKIIEWWKERHQGSIKTPGTNILQAHKNYFTKTGKSTLFEWRGGGRAHFFAPEESDIISSLQLIQEIITIFNLTCHVVCTGSRLQGYIDAERGTGSGERIDFFYQDVFGRRTPGPFLKWREGVLIRSSFGSIEGLIKHLLEGVRGTLPKWLA